MKKTFLLTTIICSLLFLPSAFAQSGLTKYLKPAQITELDWILFGIEMKLSSLNEGNFDDYRLISGATLYAVGEQNPMIKIIFYINKDGYLKVENQTMSKVFIDNVESLFKIIQMNIPEANLIKDITAVFRILDNQKEVAVYNNGKLSFTH